MTDEIVVVVRAEHYKSNTPVAAFETEEAAERWIEQESEKYDLETDDFGGEYLVYDRGRFNFLTERIPFGRQTFYRAVNNRGSGRQRKIHVDEDCYRLDRAKGKKQVTRAQVPDADICPHCGDSEVDDE